MLLTKSVRCLTPAQGIIAPHFLPIRLEVPFLKLTGNLTLPSCRNTGRHWILVAGFLATKRVENKLLVLERQFHFTVFCPKWLNQLRLCWSKSETPTQLQCNYLAIKKRKRKPLHLKDRSFIFPFFFVIDDFW